MKVVACVILAVLLVGCVSTKPTVDPRPPKSRVHSL